MIETQKFALFSHLLPIKKLKEANQIDNIVWKHVEIDHIYIENNWQATSAADI